MSLTDNKHIVIDPKKLLNEAKSFLTNKYKDSKNAKLILSFFNTSDIFWMNDEVDGFFDSRKVMTTLKYKTQNKKIRYKNEYEKPIHIPLKRNHWYSYEFDEIGYYADIECETELSILIVLVHELTHLIQFSEKRDLCEIETTRNEFDFVRMMNGDFFQKALKNL